MATDGIKIIDSDLAHDTYNMLIDYYDAGATLEQIEEKFPLIEEQGDDFETEIYALACGLAYWEIGLMTTEYVEYVKKVVKKGAFTEVWVEYLQEPEKTKEIKKRKAVTNRFLKKISAENQKIRKRKKYTKIKNFHFKKGDIFSVKYDVNKFAVFIVVKTVQEKSKFYYVTYSFTEPLNKLPTLEELKTKKLHGPLEVLGGNDISFGQKWLKKMMTAPPEKQKEIQQQMNEELEKLKIEEIKKFKDEKEEKIISNIRDNKRKTYMSELLFEHRFISLHKSKYTTIGNIELYEQRLDFGNFGVIDDFEQLDSWLFNKDKGHHYQLEYPIDLICKIKPNMTIIKQKL